MSLQLPKRPRVAKAAHSALDASIYRLSNVGPHFINCVVDPQNSGPNWSLCRDIQSSIATKFLVFVTGLCRSMQSFVTTCSLSSLLDSITTDFDNVATKFCVAILFLSQQECLVWRQQTCLKPASHVLLLLESNNT